MTNARINGLRSIELGVHEPPGAARLVPDLADPVIFEPRRGEVGAEPAARTGRQTARAQERTEQHGEVSAVANEAALGRARLGERPRIECEHAVEYLRRTPNL